jgi:hypothetical protein
MRRIAIQRLVRGSWEPASIDTLFRYLVQEMGSYTASDFALELPTMLEYGWEIPGKSMRVVILAGAGKAQGSLQAHRHTPAARRYGYCAGLEAAGTGGKKAQP